MTVESIFLEAEWIYFYLWYYLGKVIYVGQSKNPQLRNRARDRNKNGLGRFIKAHRSKCRYEVIPDLRVWDSPGGRWADGIENALMDLYQTRAWLGDPWPCFNLRYGDIRGEINGVGNFWHNPVNVSYMKYLRNDPEYKARKLAAQRETWKRKTAKEKEEISRRMLEARAVSPKFIAKRKIREERERKHKEEMQRKYKFIKLYSLKKVRMEAGLTISDLAKLTKSSFTIILYAEDPDKNWGKGKRHFKTTTQMAKKIALALNTTVEILQQPTDWQPSKIGYNGWYLKTPRSNFGEMKLSSSAYNSLMKGGVKNLDELCQKSEMQLLEIHNFGRKSLVEVQEKLSLLGLSLRSKSASVFIPSSAFNGLKLTVRATNCFKDRGIKNLIDLCQKTEAELLAIPNFGRVSLKQVKKDLSVLGLALKGKIS